MNNRGYSQAPAYAGGGMVPNSNFGGGGGRSDLNKFGMAAGLGGIGAGLGALMMGGGEDPYKAGNEYYKQIPGTVSPYYNPYIDAGKSAMGQSQGQYGQLINDPGGKFNQFGAGYQKSPGYDWQLGQGMEAANNAAASGGMAGSPQHQQQAATMATGLANQDYYNYMNHVMSMYGQGLQGNEHINDMGYHASDQLAGALGNNLMNQGNLAFSSTAAQNQSQGQMWGDLMGGASTLAMFL